MENAHSFTILEPILYYEVVKEHGARRGGLFIYTRTEVRVPSYGDDRDRTGDLWLAKPPLSQLSYIPESETSLMVGLNGVEPLTSRLSGVRSNQLSYRPVHLEPVAFRR